MWPCTEMKITLLQAIVVISMDIFRGVAVILSHKSTIFSLEKKKKNYCRSELPHGFTTRRRCHSPSTTSRQPQKVPSQQDSAPPSCRNTLGDLSGEFSPFLPQRDLRQPPPPWNMSSKNPHSDILLQLTGPPQLQKVRSHKQGTSWARLGLVLSKSAALKNNCPKILP